MRALAAGLGAAAAAAGAKPRPNVVYVMADDLNADWKNDRLAYMPNVKKYFSERGTEFENHVAVIPVCGPSRSSMLLGRYPHNTGYYANGDAPSTKAFCGPKGAQGSTLGKWLKDAGYYTAFFGKYVNGCEGHVPSGWSFYGGIRNTYDFYNATLWQMDYAGGQAAPTERNMLGVHQADFLGKFAVEHAGRAVNQSKPFFISVTPVMPHWGTCYGGVGGSPKSDYAANDPHWEMDLVDPKTGKHWKLPISPCPTDRNRYAFRDQSNPRIEGVWNVSITGPRPVHMQKVERPGELTEFEAEREDLGWQNRSAAIIDLDEMIGDIVQGLKGLGGGAWGQTYMFVTSDNGYHLGEHKLAFGKGHPYDTDVRLPMYVRGPGVVQGRVLPHPTTHIDITATIVELAGAEGAAPMSALDGKSFAQELGAGADGDAWRQHSFSEFFGGIITWQLVRVVNSTHKFSYVWWCTNDTEVFDMKADPWQSANLAGSPGFAGTVDVSTARLAAPMGRCAGPACADPVLDAASPAPGSLACYQLSS